MTRVLLVLMLVSLSVSAAVAGPSPAGPAAALRVPARFATIQAAVSAAGAGDVIEVAPGVYCEQVVITKSDVTLRALTPDSGARPIIGGDCATAGYGIKVAGTASAPLLNVEVSGFVVDGFETGILLQYVMRSRVVGNEVRDNLSRPGSTTAYRENGIFLATSSFNEIAGNFAHDNGHMGIAIRTGNGNIVRGNRLVDNQAQYAATGGLCSLMVFANSVGNQIVGNEVADTLGEGIMLGPAGVQTQNLISGNRVYGQPYAGIVIEPGSQANVVTLNDASGSGWSGAEPALLDINGTSTNVWLRNVGSCNPGNAGC